MLDYYSEQPAPPENVVVDDIISEMYNNEKYASYCLNIEQSQLTLYIKQSLKDIGGHNKLGSFTGYNVFGKHDLIKMTIETIKSHNEINNMSLKEKSRNKIQNDDNKLPPVGNKVLLTPIKETM